MDQSTKIQDLKDVIRDFCQARNWGEYHSPKDLAIGASTESAELLELFRFLSEQESLDLLEDKKSREKISDEIADVLFFLLRFSEKYDFDLAQCFFDKMKKNAQKYPVSKSKGSNKKYTEL